MFWFLWALWNYQFRLVSASVTLVLHHFTLLLPVSVYVMHYCGYAHPEPLATPCIVRRLFLCSPDYWCRILLSSPAKCWTTICGSPFPTSTPSPLLRKMSYPINRQGIHEGFHFLSSRIFYSIFLYELLWLKLMIFFSMSSH